jgi:hypothetical protein
MCRIQCKFQVNLELALDWMINRLLLFRKDRKSVVNEGKLLHSFGNGAVFFSSSEYDRNKKEDWNSFEIEHIHLVPFLHKTLGSLNKLSLSS